jgi:serine/threonine protein kinase
MANTCSKTEININRGRYSSPEMTEAQSWSFEGDVWAVGIILYGMLTFDNPDIVKGSQDKKLAFNEDMTNKIP